MLGTREGVQCGLSRLCHREDPAIDEHGATCLEVVANLMVDRFVKQRNSRTLAVGDSRAQCISVDLCRSGCSIMLAELADAFRSEHRQELRSIECGIGAITRASAG